MAASRPDPCLSAPRMIATWCQGVGMKAQLAPTDPYKTDNKKKRLSKKEKQDNTDKLYQVKKQEDENDIKPLSFTASRACRACVNE